MSKHEPMTEGEIDDEFALLYRDEYAAITKPKDQRNIDDWAKAIEGYRKHEAFINGIHAAERVHRIID